MDVLAELRRLQLRQPKDLTAALVMLDETKTLRRELMSRRDAVGLELSRLRLNLNATRAYAGVITKGIVR